MLNKNKGQVQCGTCTHNYQTTEDFSYCDFCGTLNVLRL